MDSTCPNWVGQTMFFSEIVNSWSKDACGSILPILTLRKVWFENVTQLMMSNFPINSPFSSKEIIAPLLLLNDTRLRKGWI